MANLAASGVAIQRQWVEGDVNRKTLQRCVDAIVTLAAMGTAANAIPATVFGLTYIYEVGLVITDGDTLLLGAPSYDQTKLLLFDVTNATDASRADPVDITDTVRVILKGKSAI